MLHPCMPTCMVGRVCAARSAGRYHTSHYYYRKVSGHSHTKQVPVTRGPPPGVTPAVGMVSVRPSHSEGRTNRGVSSRTAFPLHPGRGRAAARVSIKVRPRGGEMLAHLAAVGEPAGIQGGALRLVGAVRCQLLLQPDTAEGG